MTLQLRRGLAVHRPTGAEVADGEPLWDTDTHELWVCQGGVAWSQMGATGATGAPGDPGTPGAAATVSVGTVTTGAAGSSASVTNVGTSAAAVLDFVIPRGNTGAPGTTGTPGAAGPGVPTGGATGAFLRKHSATDFDTEWLAAPLPYSVGGTGADISSVTTGSLIIKGAANLQGGPVWAGSTLRVLTQKGDGVSTADPPTYQDWVTSVNGTAALGSNFTITADSTWQNTGLTITLPSLGKYIVWYSVRAIITITAGTLARVSGRLWDVTHGALVTDSERMVCLAPNATVGSADATASALALISVTEATTIRMEAERTGTTVTWSTSVIATGTLGKSLLGYVRVGEA